MEPRFIVMFRCDWVGHKFLVKGPLYSYGVPEKSLPIGTVLLTSGELGSPKPWKSRPPKRKDIYVGTTRAIRAKHGSILLEEWIRVDDLLNSDFAEPIVSSRESGYKDRIRRAIRNIENFAPLRVN